MAVVGLAAADRVRQHREPAAGAIGAARQREMSVRVALGRGRSRLVAAGADRERCCSRRLAAACSAPLVAYVGAACPVRIVHARTHVGLPRRIDSDLSLDAARAAVHGRRRRCSPACCSVWRRRGARSPRRRHRRCGRSAARGGHAVAPALRKKPRRRTGGAVGRAPERGRPVRRPPLEPAQREPRIPARLRAAGDAGSERQRLHSPIA